MLTKIPSVSRLSVAPMLDRTDRHFGYMLRQMTKRTKLYSEMVVDQTIYHNKTDRKKMDRILLRNKVEEPVAVQLGGSSLSAMPVATREAIKYNYDEVNLNVGCPSDKVQKGCFGAILMKTPQVVADLTKTMIQQVYEDSKETGKRPIPITVKCRVGVDELDSYDHLAGFIDFVHRNSKFETEGYSDSVDHFIIHARKGLLGLSPKKNRTVPDLNYEFYYRLVKDFPHLQFTLNGGIKTLEEALSHLDRGAHGVMIGRAAYETPGIFRKADQLIFGETEIVTKSKDRLHLLKEYLDYGVKFEMHNENSSSRILLPLYGLFSKSFNNEILEKWRRMKSVKLARQDFENNFDSISRHV